MFPTGWSSDGGAGNVLDNLRYFAPKPLLYVYPLLHARDRSQVQNGCQYVQGSDVVRWVVDAMILKLCQPVSGLRLL